MNMNKNKSAAPQTASVDVCVEECREFACKIQVCLAKNREQESACKHALKDWNDCCDKAVKSKKKN